MPRFESLLSRPVKPDDVVAYLQTLPEVGQETPMAVSVENGKIQAVEIDGITQLTLTSVMAKVQLQFPSAF